MSIVRVGLAETKNFSDGWDAIFSKGKSAAKTPKATAAPKKKKKAKAKKR